MATYNAITAGDVLTAANWSGGVVPGSADTANLNGLVMTMVVANETWDVGVLEDGGLAASQIQIGGTITLSAGQINCTAATAMIKAINHNFGWSTINGPISITGGGLISSSSYTTDMQFTNTITITNGTVFADSQGINYIDSIVASGSTTNILKGSYPAQLYVRELTLNSSAEFAFNIGNSLIVIGTLLGDGTGAWGGMNRSIIIVGANSSLLPSLNSSNKVFLIPTPPQVENNLTYMDGLVGTAILMPSLATGGGESILEQIILDIMATLELVTVANGYGTNVMPVRPNPGLGNAIADGLAIVSLGSATAEDPPNLAQQWRQEILIDCCVKQSETSTTSIDTRRITMLADVSAALLATYTRNGLAVDTVQTQAIFSPIDYDAHIGFVTAVFEVVYRTVYGNGYDAF